MRKLIFIVILLAGCVGIPQQGSLARMWYDRSLEVRAECFAYFFKREQAGVKITYIHGYESTHSYCIAVADITRKTGHEIQYQIKKRRGAR